MKRLLGSHIIRLNIAKRPIPTKVIHRFNITPDQNTNGPFC